MLSVAHLHHGLRGAEADDDLEFVRQLAVDLELTFHEARVDVAAEAKEQASRSRRRPAGSAMHGSANLLDEVPLDAVATAHTLDDQAETVCAKFLRGAWTEGLGGIHPVLLMATGQVIRPLLQTTRAEVESYLSELGQTWREDSSNRDVGFDRNRIRHELLPILETWNPGLRGHLAQMAILARDEEAWWQGELKRLIPQVLMEGKPVRGGGRASGDGLALDVTRFAAMAPALARRLLRHAAGQLGVKLDFRATETLRELALDRTCGPEARTGSRAAGRTNSARAAPDDRSEFHRNQRDGRDSRVRGRRFRAKSPRSFSEFDFRFNLNRRARVKWAKAFAESPSASGTGSPATRFGCATPVDRGK